VVISSGRSQKEDDLQSDSKDGESEVMEALKLVIESNRKTLDMVLKSREKGENEEEKLDQEDQRIKPVDLEKLEEPTEDLNLEGTTDLNLDGNIQFDQVGFSYPSRTDVEVLKSVSFEAKAGQKVALVGPSGAGKSTIASLLLRFYDIQKGQICIDGQPIGSYDLHDLRGQMSIVPQDVYLFGGTIRENIAYGKPTATDAEIMAAAQRAHALEFIDRFPEKWDTIVGERGIKLSGGQRQRIAIARALLKDPKILILDEATSALDSESEKLVQEALEVLMQGRTSIIIAHRLATIREADKIVVIDRGEVVEQGTHQELIAHQNGVYKALSSLQFQET
jgi:ABC-type multidrug transport system fused ATPase/permease subunit